MFTMLLYLMSFFHPHRAMFYIWVCVSTCVYVCSNYSVVDRFMGSTKDRIYMLGLASLLLSIKFPSASYGGIVSQLN